MCEKRSEASLSILLKEKEFNPAHIYYHPNDHSDLKVIFASSSKTGNGLGIPDRMYYDSTKLIIFECKKDKISKAKADIKSYFNSIKIDDNLIVYGVAYVDEGLYEIYKMKQSRTIFIMKDKTISPETFELNPVPRIDIDMKKEIAKVHDYIYQNTKISNEDKSLFIAIILIGLKNNTLNNSIDNIQNKEDLFPILEAVLRTYDINTQIFKSLRMSKDLDHLYNLIVMVKHIYEKNPSLDLLNEFYSEFIKYSNTDTKSLGIVLTPPHIVEIMTKMLNISNNDIVLDLCTGTGSFILEAHKYNPMKVIACEYQSKLYALLKCNMIIRDISNYEIYNIDCFTKDFKATKSIINPPYSTNPSEWSFIIKQLDSLEDEGECCAIIPNSNIFDSKENNKFKCQILDQAIVMNIIICRHSLFYPSADIGCVILHFKKTKDKDYMTNIIDYRNDGFVSKVGRGIIKDATYDTAYDDLFDSIANGSNKLNLTSDISWFNLQIEKNTSIDIVQLRMLKLENRYHHDKILAMNQESTSEASIVHYKEVFIGDYFDILSKPIQPYDKPTCKVYMIAAKNNNNGIKEIIDSNENTFEGGKLVVVTGGNGGAGLCFYQQYAFNITSSTKVLSPKDNIVMNTNIGLYIAYQLSKNKNIYSRSNGWTIPKIKQTTIQLPFTRDGEIHYEEIDKLY